VAEFVRLEFPSGAYRNGTLYQAIGRWRDVNLVRWRDGAMLPVGGWARYGAGTFTGVPRGCVAWADNDGNRWLAWGTSAFAYVMDDAGAITDITPAGFTTGAASATYAGGYGTHDYGEGTYGTPRPDTGNLTLATTWAWDTFGEIPIACSDADDTLYEWDLNTASNLTEVTNAPAANGLVVTAERFIFALGADGDPRRIEWCDRDNRTVWTPAIATNQAGGWNLDTDGEIMFGARARGETVIVTTTDAHVATYIGHPNVYSFKRVGTGCGAPGRRVAVRVDHTVAWLGHNGFWQYEGGYVRKIDCDVWDFFFTDLSKVQASKVFAWHNHEWDEAWWLYPSDTSNEVDSYVAWNYRENTWHYGHVPAACMVPKGVFQTPMGMHTDTKVYQHEIGYVHGTETPYAESGPFELGAGDRWLHVTKVIPDEDTLAATTLTFKTLNYPTETATSHGPYTMTEPTSVRFGGREVLVRVAPTGDSDWRFGVPRLEVRPGGRR
jgi:hypothetical protein